jgi:hypothetical protein
MGFDTRLPGLTDLIKGEHILYMLANTKHSYIFHKLISVFILTVAAKKQH